MLGFVGYPLLGVYKSISSINATAAESKILLARQIQGSEIGRAISNDRTKTQMVLKEFDRVVENGNIDNGLDRGSHFWGVSRITFRALIKYRWRRDVCFLKGVWQFGNGVESVLIQCYDFQFASCLLNIMFGCTLRSNKPEDKRGVSWPFDKTKDYCKIWLSSCGAIIRREYRSSEIEEKFLTAAQWEVSLWENPTWASSEYESGLGFSPSYLFQP